MSDRTRSRFTYVRDVLGVARLEALRSTRSFLPPVAAAVVGLAAIDVVVRRLGTDAGSVPHALADLLRTAACVIGLVTVLVTLFRRNSWDAAPRVAVLGNLTSKSAYGLGTSLGASTAVVLFAALVGAVVSLALIAVGVRTGGAVTLDRVVPLRSAGPGDLATVRYLDRERPKVVYEAVIDDLKDVAHGLMVDVYAVPLQRDGLSLVSTFPLTVTVFGEKTHRRVARTFRLSAVRANQLRLDPDPPFGAEPIRLELGMVDPEIIVRVAPNGVSVRGASVRAAMNVMPSMIAFALFVATLAVIARALVTGAARITVAAVFAFLVVLSLRDSWIDDLVASRFGDLAAARIARAVDLFLPRFSDVDFVGRFERACAGQVGGLTTIGVRWFITTIVANALRRPRLVR